MPDVTRPYRGVSADERRDGRRRSLLDAGLDLVGTGGIAAVTAESVSARAQLTKRYFYESFAGRDALLVTALDEMFDELIGEIRRAVVESAAHERAQAIAEVFVGNLLRDRRRARLYAEAPALPALHARREEAIGAFTDLLSVDGLDRRADQAERRLMTRILVSGVTDVVTSWITGAIVDDRETLISAIVALGKAIV